MLCVKCLGCKKVFEVKKALYRKGEYYCPYCGKKLNEERKKAFKSE